MMANGPHFQYLQDAIALARLINSRRGRFRCRVLDVGKYGLVILYDQENDGIPSPHPITQPRAYLNLMKAGSPLVEHDMRLQEALQE